MTRRNCLARPPAQWLPCRAEPGELNQGAPGTGWEPPQSPSFHFRIDAVCKLRTPLLVLGLALVGATWIAPSRAMSVIHPNPDCARASGNRSVCESAASGGLLLVGQRLFRGYLETQAARGWRWQTPDDQTPWRQQPGLGAGAFERGCHAAQRQIPVAELQGHRNPRFWEGWKSCSASGSPATPPEPAAAAPVPVVANRVPPPRREPRAQVQPDPGSSAYEQGLADRRAWEDWFNGLTGDYRAGAEWWSGQRSKPRPGSCYGSNVQDWTAGCVAAQQRLATPDIRRKAEPQYWWGWNSHSLSATEVVTTPPVTTSSETGSAIEASREHALAESWPAPSTAVPAQPATPLRVSAQKAAGPVLYTFSGNGSRTTRPFEVEDPWELQWDASAHIAIWVEDQSGKPVGSHAISDTSGNSYIPATGTLILEIDSSSDWTVRVVAAPQSGTLASEPAPAATQSPLLPPTPSEEHSVAPSPLAAAEPARSSAERLLSVVRDYADRYKSAPNEMAQGALRPARARVICQALPDPSATDWMGSVELLSSNNEGKGVLSVRISDSLSVETMNNALSDIPYNTLIPVGSRVQQEAMALHHGQRVVFSGSFVPDNDDCIKETSLTVWGDMTEPSFLFRFSAIRPAE